MNLIVEKTRKNDVSNTNGVFAAAHESVHGAERHLLRDSNTSEIGGKAAMAGVRPKRR
jgi:hypothetical protein